MASDLLSIGASGARAARGALDVTAQNIANASSDGYIRRSVQMEEVSASGGQGRIGDVSLSGARIAGVRRNADMFRQAEVRRTNADVTRATTELGGLEDIESAVEQAGVYPAVVEFEASLQQLAANPADPSLRAATLAGADTLARKFNIAASSLDAVGTGLRFDADAAVSQANTITAELARVNLRLSRAGEGSSGLRVLVRFFLMSSRIWRRALLPWATMTLPMPVRMRPRTFASAACEGSAKPRLRAKRPAMIVCCFMLDLLNVGWITATPDILLSPCQHG